MEIFNATVSSLVMELNAPPMPARNSTWELVLQSPTRHLNVTEQVVITAIFMLGALGNLAALGFLCRSDSKPRNSKHALMLRCLATNDLIAVLGMMGLMYLQLYHPPLAHSRWFCGLRVFWRIFGLGSGCVAIVMAVERWLALTRPFFYQKHVTLAVVRKSIFLLWAAVLVLVCLPFLGFGLYFESHNASCVRYRLATHPKDVAYAYLYLVFGTLLCLCIVWCNLAVMQALCRSSVRCPSKTPHPVSLPRRISRNQSLTFNACTREELAFAKLMALLCFVFVVCWMPQMISIPMAQVNPSSTASKIFFRLADVLMALHFSLDPYIYVLQRWPVFRSLCSGRSASRASSVKTSYQLNSH